MLVPVQAVPGHAWWQQDWLWAVRLVGALAVIGVDVALSVGPAASDTFGPWDAVLAACLLVAIAGLVRGPQPRRATKWAWFWVILLLPGIGVLFWLVLDVPWSRQASARPEPVPGQRSVGGRLSAGHAVLLVISINLALLLVLLVLAIATA